MYEQLTIDGGSTLHIPNLKSRTYRVLERIPDFVECQYAPNVALEILQNVYVRYVDTEDGEMIMMEESTFEWIIQNIPTIERYIRDFREAQRRAQRGFHVSIHPSSDDCQ